MLRYIKIDTYLFVNEQFIFSLYQDIFRSFILSNLYFLCLQLFSVDYFVK